MPAVKHAFQKDMLIGAIKGASVASADFAKDIKNYTKWIKFDGNGRTTTSNGGNCLGNAFDCRDQLTSHEQMFSVIDNFQVKTTEATPPKCWIQGNSTVTSHGVTNTHGKHRDRHSQIEKFTKFTFGIETKRIRIAVSATPPAGVHDGKIKETRYAYAGQDVLFVFARNAFAFTMMGPRANGKEPFFGSNKSSNDGSDNSDDDRAICLLDDDYGENKDDEEDEESPKSPFMVHGVYFNADALSIMFEVTVVDSKVYEFFEAFSTCYDQYVPRRAPGSAEFEFPHAATSYLEPKMEEKRLLAAHDRRSKLQLLDHVSCFLSARETMLLAGVFHRIWTRRASRYYRLSFFLCRCGTAS